MRSPRLLVPPAVAVVAALTALTACGGGGGGVHGTPGGSGVRDPYFPKAGNGGYDVTHYALDLSYDPEAHHLAGTATLTARATQDLSAFSLDLKGLHVERVTVDGEAARWNRAGQELTVRPPDDLRDGKEFRVAVRYSGAPETVVDPDGSQEGWLRTDDGAVALGQPTGSMAWFPGSHHPSDKAAYDITVTVPRGLRVVSNGVLAGERTSGDRTAFTWHTAEPMASHAVTVAIGDYAITRATTGDGLPVYTAADPDQAGASRAVLARIPEVVEWARDRFGPYPFATTGAIVEDAQVAGYALETQSRPVFPGAPDIALLVHELAHQWYGDSVTPKTWRDMWLSEGFATYAEWLWEEDHGGDTAQETFQALHDGSYFGDEAQAEAAWAFAPANPPDAGHISADPVYLRGAAVLHKIRQTVGDDAFFGLLRGWADAHRHGNAGTGDFTAYVEKKAPGHDFGRIWEEWLYGDDRPERL